MSRTISRSERGRRSTAKSGLILFLLVRLLITPPNTPPVKANYIRALCPAVNLIRCTQINRQLTVNYALGLQRYMAVNPKRY